MYINLRDRNKLSLVKRIIAHERKGYQCVAPIRQIRDGKKHYQYKDSRITKFSFDSREDREMYFVKMVKEDSA